MNTKFRNLWTRFRSKPYRRQFAESQIGTTLAAQITTMREARGWTQKELGDRAGSMKQSRISELEDPSYGKATLSTLRRLAAAFDVVLVVRFVPFSEFLSWRSKVSPSAIDVPSFDDDALFEGSEETADLSITAPGEHVLDVSFRANEPRAFLRLQLTEGARVN